MNTNAQPKMELQKKEAPFQNVSPLANYAEGVPPPEPFGSFLEAYGAHVWVYACVRAIGAAIGAIDVLPYVQQKKGGEISWVVNEKHEFRRLMDKPNPYMSGYSLREYTAAALKLTGNAYWFTEYLGSKEIRELWPLLPDMVRPVATKERMIDHYVYLVNGVAHPIAYEKVIHFREMDPSSLLFGQGAVAAAKNTIATDIFAQIWNKNFFGNSARPDAVLETDGVMEDAVRTRVLESWKQTHRGFKNVAKIALLEQGLKYNPVGSSVKDMDFVNLRKDLRTEILAAFGVPPSVVGLLEYANYSNMEQQNKMFWQNTLLPILKNIEGTLTMRAEQITFEMGTVFQADLSKVQALQPDMKVQAETVQTLVNAGVPINQIIEALDLPFTPVEGGDSPRVSQGALPAPTEQPPVKAVKKDLASRYAEWKTFDSEVRDAEHKMEASMVGFFRGQQARILKNLRENSGRLFGKGIVNAIREWFVKAEGDETVNVLFDFENEEKLMKKTAERLVRGVYYDFAVRTVQKLKPSFDFNLKDPYAEQWIANKVNKLVRQATDYTRETLTGEITEAVQEAVAAGFSEGETIAQITDRIKAVYEFAVETRAETIAKTEVIAAANAGSFEAMKQTGVERKEWLSTQDDKTRETHQELDGQERAINEAFVSPSGAALMYPGDPNAPAGEVIRCRCTVVAVKS